MKVGGTDITVVSAKHFVGSGVPKPPDFPGFSLPDVATNTFTRTATAGAFELLSDIPGNKQIGTTIFIKT